MKGSILLISKDILTYKGVIYNYQSFFENVKLLKKRYILILNEDIYVKKVYKSLKVIRNEDIEKLKEEFFGKDEEYLIDYKFNKKMEVLYIYAIKGGMRIARLCEDANKVKVVPMQMYMMMKLVKRIKERSYKCIFTYKDIYYYYSCNEGFIEESHVFNDIQVLVKRLKNDSNEDIIYIQESIKNLEFTDKANVREVDLGGILSERIFV